MEFWFHSGAPEEPWCSWSYRVPAAEQAFRRARRAGWWRRFLGVRRAPEGPFRPAPDRVPVVELPIGLIVGVRDGEGRYHHALPGLRACHRPAWMVHYLADDLAAAPALKVCAGPHGYYLADHDRRAGVILEVLRARGAATVRVEVFTPADAVRSATPELCCVAEEACCA